MTYVVLSLSMSLKKRSSLTPELELTLDWITNSRLIGTSQETLLAVKDYSSPRWLVIDFLHETNPIRQYPLPGFTDDVLTA